VGALFGVEDGRRRVGRRSLKQCIWQEEKAMFGGSWGGLVVGRRASGLKVMPPQLL
jgi:hypothetical protein